MDQTVNPVETTFKAKDKINITRNKIVWIEKNVKSYEIINSTKSCKLDYCKKKLQVFCSYDFDGVS